MKKRPLRVAVATRIYRPEPAAATFRIGALVDTLAAHGDKVEVLTVRHSWYPPTDAQTPDNVTVSAWPVKRNQEGYVRGYLSYLSFDVPLFFRLLTTHRPNVVVVEPPPTTGLVTRVVCTLRQIPYVAYLPDLWADGTAATDAPAFVKRTVRLLERFTLHGAAAVVASTPEIAQRAEDLHGISPQQCWVVRNGIDTTTFNPDGPLIPDAPTGPYAIYAGTLSEWQGTEILIQAWATVITQVPDATLVFLGQGHQEDEMATQVAALPDGGASVRMLHRVPASEAAAWLRGAQVALCTMVPNTGYDYFVPTKVFASAACGTPVLYIGPGPAAKMVTENQLGRAIAYQASAAAAAMAQMLTIPKAANEIQHRSQWAQQNASLDRVGTQTAAIVERVALADG